MAFKKINHKWLYKDVVLQIEAYIKENKLQKDDKLPTERDLAEQLGISRGTIREAFRTLEVNGIIESRPGGGRFLKAYSVPSSIRVNILHELENAEVADLLEMREVIELKIIDLVIARATEEDLENIRNALNKSNEVYETDNAFHLALAEASHNNAFYNVVKFNLATLAQIRKMTLAKPERSELMTQEHNVILEAILNKDAGKAKKVLVEHLNSIRTFVKKTEEM
ncbi:MAG: hypothetical protein JM58_00965 [Peptococcaceae bacterium BICA1-8]|nr:MAG: hypothetical protein JM58_00965 [Peptococcaceae bacterium BICA1-8]